MAKSTVIEGESRYVYILLKEIHKDYVLLNLHMVKPTRDVSRTVDYRDKEIKLPLHGELKVNLTAEYKHTIIHNDGSTEYIYNDYDSTKEVKEK